jgi:hypothetical protein
MSELITYIIVIVITLIATIWFYKNKYYEHAIISSFVLGWDVVILLLTIYK